MGDPARVVRVIDGDTIEVALPDGTRASLRYIGINTPESVAPNRPVECFALAAGDRNKQLADGASVGLERDVSDRDTFGRLLRYVYVPDGRMLNELLVAEGYARVATYPPDVKYVERFLTAERATRDAGRGLWGACGAAPATAPPTTASTCPNGCISPPPGCAIKGNISQPSREKIYHVAGGEFHAIPPPASAGSAPSRKPPPTAGVAASADRAYRVPYATRSPASCTPRGPPPSEPNPPRW